LLLLPGENQDLARQHKALMEEQESLLVKVKAQVKKREQEQKLALAIERNLREHCSKAHEAYEKMVELHLVAHPILNHYSPHKLNQDGLLGAALREGNSILISPLPEFTMKNSAFKLLPRINEGEEEEEEETYDGSEKYNKEEDSDANILQPIMDLVKTPLTITDVPHDVQPDEVTKHPQNSEQASPEQFTLINQPAAVPTQDFFRILILVAFLKQLLTLRLSMVAARVPT
ncbi:hypothetical protein BKA70DRAFT_1239218, partial [Coprinopsis sp. MPI-PUGE-AT-0042]